MCVEGGGGVGSVQGQILGSFEVKKKLAYNIIKLYELISVVCVCLWWTTTLIPTCTAVSGKKMMSFVR